MKKTIAAIVIGLILLSLLAEGSGGMMFMGGLMPLLILFGLGWWLKRLIDARFGALQSRIEVLEARLAAGEQASASAAGQSAGLRSAPSGQVPPAQVPPVQAPASASAGAVTSGPAATTRGRWETADDGQLVRVPEAAGPVAADTADGLAGEVLASVPPEAALRGAAALEQAPPATDSAARTMAAGMATGSASRHDASPPASPGLIERARAWLFGGNTVARFGLIILFLGLSFLAKYAADNAMFPIEVRLALIGVVAIGLLGVGWRLRDSRRAYALLLQGGAVAVLYLEIFSAFRFFHLMDAAPAFGLMMLVCALATFLALRQDAMSLALAGTLGGFLTPILASSGGGNHVALFSIYAILNLGIFWIARRKAWRPLYLCGFVLTFGITLLWVLDRYQPDKLPSTIGFVILFIALYAIIPVLEARRAPPQLKHYVDGTLVFGTPTIGFGLLARLLSHLEYGAAFAALGLGLAYVALAALGLRPAVAQARAKAIAARSDGEASSAMPVTSPELRGLSSALVSYVALGVGFGSLAIPLALEPRLAGLAWAFEGVALIWLGMRTHQVLTRFSGVALQALGLVIFLSRGEAMSPKPFLNAYWLGAMMLALAGYVSGWLYERWRKGPAQPFEGLGTLSRFWLQLEPLLAAIFPIVAALLTWAANSDQIERLWPASHAMLAPMLGLWTLLALLHASVGRRLQWIVLQRIAVSLLLAQVLLCMYQWSLLGGSFEQGRWWAWPLSVLVGLWVLQVQEGDDEGPAEFWTLCHTLLGVVIVALLAQAAQWGLFRFAQDRAWGVAAVGLVLAAALSLLPRIAARAGGRRPSRALALQRWAPCAVAAGLTLLFLYACTSDHGGVALQPYLPLFNPIDLSASFALLALLRFLRGPLFVAQGAFAAQIPSQARMAGLGLAGFLLLNTMLMRALSHYLNLPYQLMALAESATAQMSFSLLWAVTAAVLMTLASRRGWRPVWMAGAALLGLVVVKLFFVDLSALSALTRIVSFVGVGLMMLLIGYLSPLPPARAAASPEQEGGQP